MLRKSITYTLLTLVSVIWLVPVYLLVVNAMTPVSSYEGQATWWPQGLGLIENLTVAWEQASLGTGLLNSLLYATAAGFVAVILAALAAFAAVVMPSKRPTMWFWIIYSGTLLPLQIFLPPLFRSYNELRIYDTQMGLLLIYTAICIPFAYFLLRNYLTTVARELGEAAQLDGASWPRVFFQIHLPIIRSSLVAAFIFQFTWVWNDLLFGLTLSTSPEIRPVMAALAQLTGGLYNVGPPVALAAALVVSIPTVVLFLSSTRFFASSLRPIE
ncbi:carbohydrate ABC transporter permease [Georgenia sp. MJ173]|uniref:carbohydrate ABC transporter permease n=1 Tax=Georgenia sunbinii TaxID=3117728 RepID=UPI002F260FC0